MKKEDFKTVRSILIEDDNCYSCPFCQGYTLSGFIENIKHEDWCPLKDRDLNDTIDIRIAEMHQGIQISYLIFKPLECKTKQEDMSEENNGSFYL